MSRPTIIVSGNAVDQAESGKAVFAMSLRVGEYASASGLRVRSMVASRITNSRTRYLVVVDRGGNHWTIRVSNHRRPRRTGHPEPHLDFVSLDGVSGFRRFAGQIDLIAKGIITWWQPKLSRRRKGQR